MLRSRWNRRAGRGDRRCASGEPSGGRDASRPGPGSLVRNPGATAVLLLLLLASADARRDPGPDVHRPDADCRTCHTADAAALKRDPVMARSALVPDLDAHCMACHAGEGPSHKTGVRPRATVPAGLPLSGDGLITCATCHFMHGEGDRAHDYQRIDNRRGQLCLTCHSMSELR
jgi:hypothetical protein